MNVVRVQKLPFATERMLALSLFVALGCSESMEPADVGAGPELDASAEVDAEVDAGLQEPDNAGLDAGNPNACSEEGQSRITSCGMCGRQSQACVTGEWAAQSECLNQGECQVGAVETEDTAACGQRQRICLDGCRWGSWSTTVEDGVCIPGTIVEDHPDGCGENIAADARCNDSCEFETLNPADCTTECGPRVGRPRLEERLCVPAGDTTVFETTMIGWDIEDVNAHPVSLSMFEIDRFPVTIARFQACLDAGDCVGSVHPGDPGNSARVNGAGARSFCASLGGQLPTLAQLWRASRGDCPHFATFPWNACEPGLTRERRGSCETIVWCGDPCATPENSICDEVGDTPASAGVFGVEEVTVPVYGGDLIRDGEGSIGPGYAGLDPLIAEPSALGVSLSSGMVRRIPGDRGSFRCVWGVEE